MSTDPSKPPTIVLGTTKAVLVEPMAIFAIACGRTKEQRDAMDPTDLYALDVAYGAAALRMAWPPKLKWPAPMRPRPWAPGQRVGEYGADIFEGLRRATKGTVSMGELQAACLQAVTWSLRSALTETEVTAAMDFSAGQGE